MDKVLIIMTFPNKVIKINEFPQPLPEKNELEQIRWEFPFGQALSQDSLKGALRFVYTECETFIQAIEPKYRIIMGRKGSGKTALIKRICLGNEYDVKVICKKEELLKWVDAAIERNSVEEELIEPYVDRCIHFFWISIFQSLVQNKDLKNIKEFLSHSNLDEGTILGGIQEWSSVNIDAKNPFASVSAGIINTFINSVKEGIKNWEKNLCQEVFSSFRETYPNAEEFCSQHLRKLPMSFRSSTLRSEVYDKLDSNNSDYQIYKSNYMLVERMLFDLGILGVGIKSNNQSSKVHDTYNIAEFEPNCDDNFSPNQNDDIFVHPMFIHKINFIRDLGACSKPVCPVKAIETLELFDR